MERVVESLGRLQVAGVEAARELRDGARRDVGDGADQPRAAEGERRQAQQLDPAPDERVATAVVEDIETCSKSFVVSLIPTMLSCLRIIRASVSGATSTAVRMGTL